MTKQDDRINAERERLKKQYQQAAYEYRNGPQTNESHNKMSQAQKVYMDFTKKYGEKRKHHPGVTF